jgi:hypothetical protein
MSLRERQKRIQEKYPVHNFRYVPKQLSVFGQDARAVTIGTVGQRIVALETTPGPGHYKVRGDSMRVKMPHVIQNRKSTDYRSVSSLVDFAPLRPFTQPKTRIGERDSRSYFQATDTPAPIYLPKQFRSSLATAIGVRAPPKEPEDLPGPGTYDLPRPSTVSCSMPRAVCFGFWEGDSRIPGPGKYNTVDIPEVPNRWTSKLRVDRDVVIRQSAAEKRRLNKRRPKEPKEKNDYYPHYEPLKC